MEKFCGLEYRLARDGVRSIELQKLAIEPFFPQEIIEPTGRLKREDVVHGSVALYKR